jgi:hypothetical protein
LDPEFHLRTRLAPPGFRQPHDAFIPAVLADHLSGRIRSWGSSPSKLCSSHAAVRRSRRLCPLVVEYPRCNTDIMSPVHETEASQPENTRDPCSPRAPRLQGFAPRESPPPSCDGLDHSQARSSLGLVPSRVPTLTAWEQPSLLHPLMRLPGTNHHRRNDESSCAARFRV